MADKDLKALMAIDRNKEGYHATAVKDAFRSITDRFPSKDALTLEIETHHSNALQKIHGVKETQAEYYVECAMHDSLLSMIDANWKDGAWAPDFARKYMKLPVALMGLLADLLANCRGNSYETACREAVLSYVQSANYAGELAFEWYLLNDTDDSATLKYKHLLNFIERQWGGASVLSSLVSSLAF